MLISLLFYLTTVQLSQSRRLGKKHAGCCVPQVILRKQKIMLEVCFGSQDVVVKAGPSEGLLGYQKILVMLFNVWIP